MPSPEFGNRMAASDRQLVVSAGKTPERKNNREYSFELPGLPEKQTSATSLAGRLSISMDFWFICEEPSDPVFLRFHTITFSATI